MTDGKGEVEAKAEPWHAAYPTPSSEPAASITPAELLSLMHSGQRPGRDFLLVDLRRTDHKGGTIRGSLNLPAQSLFPSLPTIYDLCAKAGISTVIWYCGSSRGRGTRAAGWFHDLILARGDVQMKSMILVGGIQAWATAGYEYQLHMDEYQADEWLQNST